MIDSVKNDPEHLRATVYELARHKLKEQLKTESFAEFRKLSKSLEVAIEGVEQFSRKDAQLAPALPRPSVAELVPPVPTPARQSVRPTPSVIEAEFPEPAFGRRGDSSFRMIWRLAVVAVIIAAAVFAVRMQGWSIESLRKEAGRLAGLTTAVTLKAKPNASQPALAPAAVPIATPLPPDVPTSFGVYAFSQNKLLELEQLPGKVPDMRVAVSAAIQAPSRTTLPDGHIKFVIYRRDSATNAPDRAEVRIVAKIGKEISFNPAGKAIEAKPDDAWVVRNVAIPFRTAPKKDNPEMYEVLSETAESVLAPGRYALVLKGQAYDFNVAGAITDPRQCLERLAATNGQFYSECKP